MGQFGRKDSFATPAVDVNVLVVFGCHNAKEGNTHTHTLFWGLQEPANRSPQIRRLSLLIVGDGLVQIFKELVRNNPGSCSGHVLNVINYAHVIAGIT